MVSSSYEKAKKTGRTTPNQYAYLKAHGFDMSGIAVNFQEPPMMKMTKGRKEMMAAQECFDEMKGGI